MRKMLTLHRCGHECGGESTPTRDLYSEMNFFGQQDHARRQSKLLVLLFALAVVAIVLAVNVVMAVLWILMEGQPWSGARHYPHGFFLTNTVVTVILICGGTLIETFNLRD